MDFFHYRSGGNRNFMGNFGGPVVAHLNPAQERYRGFYFPLFVALISGAAIQIAGGLIWGGKLVTRVEQLESQNIEQNKYMERIDVRGSSQLPILDQRLKSLEDTVRHNTTRIDAIQQNANGISPVMQAQLDNIKANLTRIEEAAKRAADNIDELYRQLSIQKRK